MYSNIELGSVAAAAPDPSNPHNMSRDELIVEVIRLRNGIEDMIKINTDGLTVLDGESHAVLARELVESNRKALALKAALVACLIEMRRGRATVGPLPGLTMSDRDEVYADLIKTEEHKSTAGAL